MKKNRNIKIILIVFTVLSLMYTAYMLVRSYQTVLSYYGTAASIDVIADYLIQTSFQPLTTSVILYALSCLFDGSKDIKVETVETVETPEVKEEPKEEKEIKESEEKDIAK